MDSPSVGLCKLNSSSPCTSTKWDDLTDDALMEEVKRLASKVSHYEAAEGSYYSETALREAAKAEFRAADAALNARGLTFDRSGYLL